MSNISKEELSKRDKLGEGIIKIYCENNKKADLMSQTSKNIIYILIFGIILIGCIVPFAAQFILPFFYPESKIAGAEVWNQYVSIVLGVVATITSIVSLVLSLRSEEQAYETERRTRDLLNDILREVAEMSCKQEEMNRQLYSDRTEYKERKKEVDVNLGKGKVVNVEKGEDDTIVE